PQCWPRSQYHKRHVRFPDGRAPEVQVDPCCLNIGSSEHLVVESTEAIGVQHFKVRYLPLGRNWVTFTAPPDLDPVGVRDGRLPRGKAVRGLRLRAGKGRGSDRFLRSVKTTTASFCIPFWHSNQCKIPPLEPFSLTMHPAERRREIKTFYAPDNFRKS